MAFNQIEDRESVIKQNIRKLKEICNPYHLKSKLEQTSDYFTNHISNADRLIFDQQCKRFISNYVPSKLRTLLESEGVASYLYVSDSDLTAKNIEIATKRASLYFKQALELLSTSLNVSDNIYPLLEYYAFLQCVKGFILTRIKINSTFFSLHGVSCQPHGEFSIKANCKPIGVLAGLILAGYTNKKLEEMLDYFIFRRYEVTLEEIIRNVWAHGNPVSGLIGSNMLSSLVRYHPDRWFMILEGEITDINLKIEDYQISQIHRGLGSILNLYYDWPFFT